MTALEKVLAINEARKTSNKSVQELCKEHQISFGRYYALRRTLSPKAKTVKTMAAAPKKKYIRRTKKVVDIPLAEAPTKIYIIACEVSDLKKVVGQL